MDYLKIIGVNMLGLFSERNKAKNIDDVIIYDELPKKLRIQIKFIIEDILGPNLEGYKLIHEVICREHGKLSLSTRYSIGYEDKKSILDTIIKDDYDISLIFDIVKMTFRYQYNKLKNHYTIEEIDEELETFQNILNSRFKESSVGYKIVNYEIIKIDSEATFTGIIEPTINLTYNKLFENVNNEYINAIKAYEDENNEICLVNCLKSFESTMKIICDKKGWEYKESDNSSKLIKICFEKELIPKKMQSEFSSLRGLLESGIPPVRNHYGGHGKGSKNVIVEDHLARYALNITGSCILFLIESSGL